MKLTDISADKRVHDLVKRALEEDVGRGDLTTLALVPADRLAKAQIIARKACVVAGLRVAGLVFKQVDPELHFQAVARDGDAVAAGQVIGTLEGRARAILTGERTALNFLQRLSGIATLTSQFVAKVASFGVAVLDTRKTTPTLRLLEKYAVLCGGGTNHRFGLYDMILIKDNHRHLWQAGGTADLGAAVLAARRKYPGVAIEVEVENEADLQSALAAAPEWILLDNMAPDQMRRCVALCGGRSRLEASGGITLANVEAVAATGVNALSLGCLTHSAPAVDLSLELED